MSLSFSFLGGVSASALRGPFVPGPGPGPGPGPIEDDPYFYAVPALFPFENSSNWLDNVGYVGGSATANGSFSFISGGPFTDYGAGGRTSTGSSSNGRMNHNNAFTGFPGAFTVECWYYLGSTLGTQHGIFSKYTTNGNQRAWALVVEGADSNKLRALWSFNGSGFVDLQSNDGVPLNEWFHCCLERNADNLMRLYLNGEVVASTISSGTLFNNPDAQLLLNGYNTASASNNNRISQARITRGVARYNGAFNVPTEPFDTAQSALVLPPDVKNKLYHFDASRDVFKDTEETPAENNDTVRVWGNQGLNEDAQQSSESIRPLYKTGGLNGKPYVQGDGARYFEDIAFTQPAGVFTLDPWFVAIVTHNVDFETQNFHGILGNSANAFAKVSFYFRDAEDNQIHLQRIANRRGNVTNPQIIIGAVGRNSNQSDNWSRAAVYQNGNQLHDGSETQTPNGAEITATNFMRHTGLTGGSSPIIGDIYEIAIVKVENESDGPSVAAMREWERYFSVKYGITLET